MRDLWSNSRVGPQLESLAYRFEKAGLTLDMQPVPWNAEAVLVEATILRPRHLMLQATDFSLHLADGECLSAAGEARGSGNSGPLRLNFRLPVPAPRTVVELLWQSRSLGQMTIPVLSHAAFTRQLALEMPTLSVRLGQTVVPCQTYVSTQASEILTSVLVSAEHSLAPVRDLDLHVEFGPERGPAELSVPARLTGAQLAARRALVTVGVPKPRRSGAWVAVWKVGNTAITRTPLRAVTRPHFHRSLRLIDTRFVVEGRDGRVRLMHQLPPAAERNRIGPCFVLKSAERGMAGVLTCQIRAQVKGAARAPLLIDEEVLITDGPNPIAPGTFAAADLEGATGFELCVGNKVIGVCSFGPLPTASFTREGGFKSAAPFLWTETAESELNQRLSRLLGGTS